jgi:hypothetical protein
MNCFAESTRNLAMLLTPVSASSRNASDPEMNRLTM